MNYKTTGKERRIVKMTDENSPTDPSGNGQLELNFPSTDEFPSYDEVESDDGQAQLPDDSFDGTQVDFEDEGCGCV